jgi:hypothetical protein
LGELDRARVAAAARGLRVAERIVWRWLAESDRGDIGRKPRPRFEVTTSDNEDLAYWAYCKYMPDRLRLGLPRQRRLYRKAQKDSN